MNRINFLAFASLTIAALCLVGCGGCSSEGEGHGEDPLVTQGSREVTLTRHRSGAAPIRIVVTTGMVADIVSHVGGKQVELTQLMGADTDPHLYKAGQRDSIACKNADIIFYSGLHLEGKLSDFLSEFGRENPVFPITQFIPPDELLGWDQGVYDPHAWFDVSLWSKTIPLVREVLSKYDPDRASEYAANATAYEKELAELHEECKAKLATIPKTHRVLVTAHDAFRYFGRAYDIEVHGIQGISTESEAGLNEVNRLVNMLVDRKIKAVFVESTVSEQNIRSLLEGCKAKGHTVVIGGSLFSDAMGAANTSAGTYPGMVRHNVETIHSALK
jgi:manganese/zinc/iron transport system substrate-binding protein